MILESKIESNFHIMKEKKEISRRDFLKKGAIGAVGGLLLPNEIFAKEDDVREINIYNVHTGKSIKGVYYENGAYLADALNEIYDIMGDYRAHEVMQIDNQLIDLIHQIQKFSGKHKPIELLSGYRSPMTNYKLRKHHRGVAKHSYHILGKAADIRIPKLPLRLLRRIAMHLGKGGVGYYPHSGFVHVDVGPVRHWRG